MPRPSPPPVGWAASLPDAWAVPVPPPRRRGWLIALAIVGALVLVGAVTAIVVGLAVSDRVDHDIDEARRTCRGFTYDDPQDRDHCAAMGGPVRDFGQTVTVTALRRVPSSGFNPAHVCAEVSYVNRDSDGRSFSEYDWRLQTPGGTIHDSDVDASSLGDGEMPARGKTSGSVCFEDNGERGQVAVVWDPDEFRDDRGVWVGSL